MSARQAAVAGREAVSPVGPDVVARRAEIEAAWGPTWQPRTLAQVLDVVATRHPERPYVLAEDRAWTYAELADWSIRLAAGLRAAGIRDGDRVAVDLANGAEIIVLKFAVARLGATTVAINFLLRHDELRYVLAQSRAALLITMDTFRDLDYLAALDRIAPRWESGDDPALPALRDVFVFPTQSPQPARGRSLVDLVALGAAVSDEQIRELSAAADPRGVSDILYTSGTTGSPKGVMLSHEAIVRTGFASAFGRAMEDGYRIVFALPIYHVFGYIEATMAVPFVAGAVCPQVVFDAQQLLRAVEQFEVDEIMGIPAMTVAVLDHPDIGRYDLSSVRTVFSSGTPDPPGTWERICERFPGRRLFSGYGQTETTAAMTLNQYGDPLERFRTTIGRAKPAGIAGDPALDGALARYQVRHPETGERLGAGEVGELVVRGPAVTAGYFDKPEETAVAFTADGWLHTGDLGRIDEQGYVTLAGRIKESYRCGGELVLGAEVEQVLVEHPAVAAAHVVGIPHDRMGEVGCAWIVPAPGAQPDPADLIAYTRERLARFKVPAHVLITSPEQIPLTVTGRVRKHVLTQRAVIALAGQ